MLDRKNQLSGWCSLRSEVSLKLQKKTHFRFNTQAFQVKLLASWVLSSYGCSDAVWQVLNKRVCMLLWDESDEHSFPCGWRKNKQNSHRNISPACWRGSSILYYMIIWPRILVLIHICAVGERERAKCVRRLLFIAQHLTLNQSWLIWHLKDTHYH